MNQSKKLGIVYLITFAIMIFLNYWSATNVGNVADANQPLLQPAGFAFSIWGFIYFLLFIWIIRAFFVRGDAVYVKTSYLPALNFLLNGCWILAFTAQALLTSVIIIFALLVTLILIYGRINDTTHTFFEKLPFSIYIGWVSVASILNVFVWFVGMEQTVFLGLNEVTWTFIMLAVATILAIVFSIRFKDFIYTLVFIWAYIGIYAETPNDAVKTFVMILILLLIVIFIYTLYKFFKK